MPVPDAVHPGPRRRPAAAVGLVLLVVVLWLHALLIQALGPAGPPRAGSTGRSSAVLQVRALAGPAPGPAEATAPVVAAAPAVAAAPPVRPPGPWPAVVQPPAAAPGETPPRDAAEGATSADMAAPSSPAADSDADGAAGSPPPVYPTQLPAPVRLRYALRYNGRDGEATLTWRHDGVHYQLQLDGQGATQALVEQRSDGGFDAAGVAPERFTDRRRGRGWQAAHFRRDIGRIGFSGPQVDYPAWPGAQDRLSWLPQLVAILSAVALPPPQIDLFVVDARGAAGLWRFVAQGEGLPDSTPGARPLQHWRREPPRPEGLRVDAWLDPALGHWPAQLRFTALRSGDVFELRRATEPGPP